MCEVEMIMGLNESGKTRFLNTYLEMTNVNRERILILMIGYGNSKLNINLRNVDIKLKSINSIFEINEKRIDFLMNMYNPHRTIIEGDYLSVKKIQKLIGESTLKDNLVITSRIEIINPKHIRKMLNYNLNKINSNIIIINNFNRENLNDEDLKKLKIMNNNSFLFCIEDFNELYSKFKYYGLIKSDFHKNFFKYFKEYIWLLFDNAPKI